MMDLEGVILDFLIAFVVGTGWALLFGVPKRFLCLAGLLGGVGHATRFLLLQLDMGIITATLLACVLVGLLSIFLAYYLRKPSVIFTMPACITMIPGLFAYRAMMGGIQMTDLSVLEMNPFILTEVAHNLTLTISLLFALAFGISLGAILSRMVGRR